MRNDLFNITKIIIITTLTSTIFFTVGCESNNSSEQSNQSKRKKSIASNVELQCFNAKLKEGESRNLEGSVALYYATSDNKLCN